MAKKPVVEVGKWAPSNLKFGIIVAVAILWAYFFRSVLYDISVWVNPGTPLWAADLSVAVIASVVGYLILRSYRRLLWRLKKIKM